MRRSDVKGPGHRTGSQVRERGQLSNKEGVKNLSLSLFANRRGFVLRVTDQEVGWEA